MSKDTFDFTSLVHPIAPEKFFEEYWENKPLYLQRGEAIHYAGLITKADIEHIISSTDVRYPAIRLAKNGSYLPPAQYTTNLHYGDDVFTGVPDLTRIGAEYQSGATVVLPALHRTWPPLRQLVAELEERLDHVVHTNVYLTPGNVAGFSAHYDAHDVFILQIDGKKHWRIYPPPLLLPHHTQPFVPRGYTRPAPLIEVALTAGDVLYLPRGYVHETVTSEIYSAHITLGITVYTWVELAQELLTALKDSLACRHALPPGFASRDEIKSGLKQTLLQLLDEALKTSDLDRIVDSFGQRVTMGRMGRSVPFHADVTVLGLDTALAAPERSRYDIAQENGNVTLHFDSKRLVLPAYVRSTLEAMASRGLFTGRELPPDLDDAAKLVLLHYLHGEGFVAIARP